MRRVLVVLLALAAVAAGGFAWVDHTQPGWWVRLRYPLYYRDSIVGYGRQYHLDPALIAAVVYEESRFKANSRSSAGAIGLMQLLPSTARGIATHTGGTTFDPRHDLYDADLNLRYGTWYLAHLRQKYADRPDSGDLALAAYNAGQANVDEWIAQTPAGQAVRIRFPATREYVQDVHRLRSLYRKAYGSQLGSG
jgi:soluble lytic murein transglycosylase